MSMWDELTVTWEIHADPGQTLLGARRAKDTGGSKSRLTRIIMIWNTEWIWRFSIRKISSGTKHATTLLSGMGWTLKLHVFRRIQNESPLSGGYVGRINCWEVSNQLHVRCPSQVRSCFGVEWEVDGWRTLSEADLCCTKCATTARSTFDSTAPQVRKIRVNRVKRLPCFAVSDNCQPERMLLVGVDFRCDIWRVKVTAGTIYKRPEVGVIRMKSIIPNLC